MNSREGTILKPDSREWYGQLAHLVSSVETPDFPATLVETLKRIVPFDYSVFFAYRGAERPICVHDTFTPRQRIVFVTDYQEGPYLLDPFYQVCADGFEPGLYRLREIAPDRFYHSEYYRSYYRRTGLAEEIGFLVALPHGMRLVVSLMRAGTSTAFSDRDFGKLRRFEPVVHACAVRQWSGLGANHAPADESGNPAPSLDMQVSSAFESFGAGLLTRREREVVRMVLRGHSSESIGKHFGISTGTVKIHRKNIYGKLGISSQSELFSLFISFLSGETGMEDPATREQVRRAILSGR